MLEFKPKKLKIDLKNAMLKLIQFSNKTRLFSGYYEIFRDDFEFDEYDEIITKKSLIELYLSDYEGEISQITCENLIKIANEIEHAELIDNLECKLPRKYLIRVEAEDYQSYINIYSGLNENYDGSISGGFEIKTTFDGKSYTVRILNGNILFRLVYANKTKEHKDSPLPDFDYFIEISSEINIETSDIQKILAAYKFEMATTNNIKMQYVPLPSYKDYYEEDEDDNSIIKLRPLLIGKGLGELTALFNNANESFDSEIQILSFTKIFEYVSQTILREQLNVIIFNKLNCPSVLTPDANYIRELEILFEQQKLYKKDKEAITLTVQKSCDALELKKHAPQFLSKLNNLTIESKENERKKALEEFATALVDTRNSVAHAKSNYTPTGNECPAKELSEFAECVKFAAEQVIRAFNNIDISKRIC